MRIVMQALQRGVTPHEVDTLTFEGEAMRRSINLGAEILVTLGEHEVYVDYEDLRRAVEALG